MQRIKAFDLARGFTVLMIAPIHTVMLYSSPEVHNTLLGYFLTFIAEGPGAQLFMLLTGVYFSFRRQSNWSVTLKRSSILLLGGYALNILKFVLPMAIGIIPVQMKSDLEVTNDCSGLLQVFLLGDILHFAAIALLILFVIRRSQRYQYWALIITFIVAFSAPFFWDANSNNPFLNYLLQLLGGQPPHVFFPVLPWLVYPLAGLILGESIRQYADPVKSPLLKVGIPATIGGFATHALMGKQYARLFYRTYPWDTCWHLGIVLLVLYCWQWIDRHFKPNKFFKLLFYYSQNITSIYFIQWVLIIWLLPVFGYQQLNHEESLIAILITSTGTYLITVLIGAKSKQHYR